MGKRAQRKQKIKQMLIEHDWPNLLDWASEQANPSKDLFPLLFDPELLIQWRAIEAMGKLCAQIAAKDIEKVRKIIRQVLWLMNDESGGLLWNGPEVVAVILLEVPSLLDEYGRILASFLIEEPFELGAHWALTHLAPKNPTLFSQPDVIENLRNSLSDSNPATRAYALSVLFALNVENPEDTARQMLNDNSDYNEYDLASGQLLRRSVSQTAGRLLDDYTNALDNQPPHVGKEVW